MALRVPMVEDGQDPQAPWYFTDTTWPSKPTTCSRPVRLQSRTDGAVQNFIDFDNQRMGYSGMVRLFFPP